MKKFFGSAAFLALFGVYSLAHYPDPLTVTNPSAPTTSTGTVASAQSAPPPSSFGGDEDSNQLDEYGEDGSGASAPSQTTPAPTQTTPTPKPTPAPAPVPTKPKGQYVDGSYTGPSVYAYYGNVQVRATISGGKIADVQFLQYPNDRNTSRYINSQAMPLLTQEAIQAQSANVSGVSGASDTSAGFRESLAAALTQAKS